MKKILSFLMIFTILPILCAADAAAPAADAEKPAVPDVLKEDFTNNHRFIFHKIQTHDAKGKALKQVNPHRKREYKDGSLIIYYQFDENCHSKDYGTLSFGLASNQMLKGSNVLEVRYRTPQGGMSNILTWTCEDAKGKRYGDWIRLPGNSTDWQTLAVEMDTGGYNGKKRAAKGNPLPKPVKLITLQINSSPRRDNVERSIEIDYFRVPGAPAAETEQK